MNHSLITKSFIKDWKEYKRTICEIYTRVMGYHRSVSQYNIWKKSEFYSRTLFTESKSCNSKFIESYS